MSNANFSLIDSFCVELVLREMSSSEQLSELLREPSQPDRYRPDRARQRTYTQTLSSLADRHWQLTMKKMNQNPPLINYPYHACRGRGGCFAALAMRVTAKQIVRLYLAFEFSVKVLMRSK
jgi:hypothetical protein